MKTILVLLVSLQTLMAFGGDPSERSLTGAPIGEFPTSNHQVMHNGKMDYIRVAEISKDWLGRENFVRIGFVGESRSWTMTFTDKAEAQAFLRMVNDPKRSYFISGATRKGRIMGDNSNLRLTDLFVGERLKENESVIQEVRMDLAFARFKIEEGLKGLDPNSAQRKMDKHLVAAGKGLSLGSDEYGPKGSAVLRDDSGQVVIRQTQAEHYQAWAQGLGSSH